MHKRHGERGARQLGAVRRFRHDEVIAHQHASFHRRGGDGERFHDEHTERACHDGGPNQGFAPLTGGGFAGFGPIALSDPRFLSLTQFPQAPPGQGAHDPLVFGGPASKGQPQLDVHHCEHDQIDAGHKQENGPVPRALDEVQPHEKVPPGDGPLPSGCVGVFPSNEHRQGEKLHQHGEQQEDPRNEGHA